VIEHAKEKKLELWIATQDMQKAYDSVSLTSLQLSLERLDMPRNFINWIIDLFRNRHINAITAFGFTPTIEGKDGIDQGDPISPLLWRIFYDPLLIAIQSASQEQQGFHMTQQWPCDINNKTSWQHYHINIPILAYMDDTTYIDSSRTRIQMSIDIANEFYDLHDIDINGKKSELIVFNSKEPLEEQNVCIGRNHDIVPASTGEVRYLGCYFLAKQNRKRLIKRITIMIEEFIKPLRSKRISNAHVVYLVNKILNPRIAYVAQLISLNIATWDKLYKPILRLVKNKCNLPRSTPIAALQLKMHVVNKEFRHVENVEKK
jgi:hypothetical protein